VAFPPQAVFCRPGGCNLWSQPAEFKSTSKLVFCHRDASQSNIYVDPVSIEVVAIDDWEYGGLYPESHKSPFYESPKESGLQVRTISGAVEIKEIWQKAACVSETRIIPPRAL